MEKKQAVILCVAFVTLFFLVYFPHLGSRFPLHVDEWHHIQEALEIKDGDHTLDSTSFRIGFQWFLVFLSFFMDLVSTYHLLPAIWAIFSALVLYFIVYKKTENIWVAILSVLFFASIKSNVNLLGLWFFTPLTFSMPFIFAFIYFYTEGLEKKNKKLVLWGLFFMVLLIPIHIISFSFAFPFLILFSLLNWNYIKSEWKFFSVFLIIPLLAILFYSFILSISLSNLFEKIISELSFEKGWGIYERNNSPLEIYSLVGYFFAIIGFFVTLFSKRKFLAYLLLPLTILFSIFFFKSFDVSLFSPYQRNMVYFAISLPFLSALGFYWFFKKINDLRYTLRNSKNFLFGALFYFLIFISILSIFIGYGDIPVGINVYYPINENQFSGLKFLESQEKGVVIINSMAGLAVYPVAHQEPFSTLFFYGLDKKAITQKFFKSDCENKNQIINEYNLSYVFSDSPIDCDWKAIYNESVWIYDVKDER